LIRQTGPTGHLPGNVDAIDGEVRRLDDVKERLWSTGETLRKLTIDRWYGPARDSFEEFRHRFAHQWLTTGDLHEDAARALERYHRTLAELQARAATADPTTTNTAATADMARWNQQLDSEARAAATAIRRASQALACLPRLLDQRATPTTTATPPARPNITALPTQTLTGDSGNHIELDPRTAQANPPQFHRRVQALSDEILLADFITITPI
jgi:hypothetical protein